MNKIITKIIAENSRLLKNILSDKILDHPRNLKMLIKGRQIKKDIFCLDLFDTATQKHMKKAMLKSNPSDIVSIGDNPFIENHANLKRKYIC